MGYYASGDGNATLKKDVDIEKLETILEEATKNNDIEFDFSELNGEKCISFWESDSHWHEEDSMEFYDALIPYIVDGVANYSGEEDCIWRYVYDSDSEEWKEESATIDYGFESYSDEELIAELVKRGYKVNK